MLPIYVCDDDKRQAEFIAKIINDIIIEENKQNELYIICASQDPEEILYCLYKNQKQSIYFIDIDLGDGKMNGLELGKKIRGMDPRGFIIIVTIHSEMTLITYKCKIEAMDFIDKEQPLMMPIAIKECLLHALELSYIERTSKEPGTICFQGKQIYELNEVILIEARQNRPGRINVVTLSNAADLAGALSDIILRLGDRFCQCHKSYIINLMHVKGIDKGYALMDNGIKVPISFRRKKRTERMYREYLSKI